MLVVGAIVVAAAAEVGRTLLERTAVVIAGAPEVG